MINGYQGTCEKEEKPHVNKIANGLCTAVCVQESSININ